MTIAEVRLLAEFRRRYRGLTWDQLGNLFGCSGIEARNIWLVYTDVDGPEWWRAARYLWAEGLGCRRIGRALDKDKRAVTFALRRMELAA